ncbi:hypothetical protein V2S85_03060 [Novosphingobium resinovorum]|nr:hypothetical protein [Novosphingobium resinovorum]
MKKASGEGCMERYDPSIQRCAFGTLCGMSGIALVLFGAALVLFT